MRLTFSLLSACVFIAPAVSAQTDAKPASAAKVFTYADQMPAPGYDYEGYLDSNLHYPDSAREHDIEGRVVVKFVVNEDGRISDCSLVNSVNSYLDEEALRVLVNMPPWKPGIKDGKPVKVYFTKPIRFKLTD